MILYKFNCYSIFWCGTVNQIILINCTVPSDIYLYKLHWMSSSEKIHPPHYSRIYITLLLYQITELFIYLYMCKPLSSFWTWIWLGGPDDMATNANSKTSLVLFLFLRVRVPFLVQQYTRSYWNSECCMNQASSEWCALERKALGEIDVFIKFYVAAVNSGLRRRRSSWRRGK